MYYESKKERRRDKIILIAFMSVIIVLLCVLIIRSDYNREEKNITTGYDANKLSTTSEETVDKDATKTIADVVYSVVGISKLQQTGNSIFLDDSEEKLGLGSGVVVTENGYILTNHHVAGNKYSNCYVTMENGTTYDGTVVWSDSNIDLAIVKISAENLNYLELADSDKITLAEDVYAIGNPIGIEFQRTVTKGIISGINRTIKFKTEESYMEDLIQTDATINEGNSGGALVNTKGELIGINAVKITDAEGIGFAVPINIVKPILEKLVQTGKFEEGYLGIYGYDKEVIPYLDSSLNINSGIYIATILPDGALFNKGALVGDIITKIDGIEINKMNDLKKYIYTKKPKDTVKLTIRRHEKEFDIDVQLGYKMN